MTLVLFASVIFEIGICFMDYNPLIYASWIEGMASACSQLLLVEMGLRDPPDLQLPSNYGNRFEALCPVR
jgi:hypothetical protein